MARRRRSWRVFITRPLPLSIAVIGLSALCYGLWPSGQSDARPPKLMSEVEKQAGQSALPVPPAPARTNPGRLPPAPELAADQAAAAFAEPRANPPASPATQPALERPAPLRSAGSGDFEAGMAAKSRNEPIAARTHLNQALSSGALTGKQLETARHALIELATQTIFSANVIPGDTLVEHHQVAAGETLNKIAKRYSISEDLLAEVNRIRDKNFIRQGMRLKVIRGPFHATVTKSDHMMHLYLGDLYIRSYRVALGAGGKTPGGKWKVTSRQSNPGWVDPQTGKRYHPEDPANPIGEYWIGLEGVEGAAVGAFGYGVHGTNEPQTIGQDVSLGCIRLAPDDIALVYRLLLPGASYVTTLD